MRSLISSAKDGLLKVWDLERQLCVGTFGDATLSKVNDFCLVGELGLLIAGGSDNQLKVFSINLQTDENGPSLKFNSNLVKDSNHRVI